MAKPPPGIPASADPSRASDGRWVPGRTGNPNGRPKGRKNTNTIVEELPVPLHSREELAEFHGMPIEMLREDGTLWDWIYAVAAWQAVKGFADARNALLDRREAKQARTEITGPGGTPLFRRPPANAADSTFEDTMHAIEHAADRPEDE